MRKTFFFFLLLPLAALSQPKEPKTNAAGQFEYSQIVTVAGASADQLYSIAKKFSSLRTPITTNADKTVNTLCYARDIFYDKSEKQMEYKVSIQCMEGKYKYTINDFSIYKQSASDNKSLNRYWPKEVAETKEWIATVAEDMEDIIKKTMDASHLTPLERIEFSSYYFKPVVVSETLVSGAKISLLYEPSSQRGTIGITADPFMGSSWCLCGTNPTLFDASRDIAIGGNVLPAGRYILTSVMAGDYWTINFGRSDDHTGKYYSTSEKLTPVLNVKVKEVITDTRSDKLMFTIKDGNVTLWYGEFKVAFKAE